MMLVSAVWKKHEQEINTVRGGLYWAQDPCQSAIFFILHKHGSALTKAYLVNKYCSSFWLLLMIQNVMHMTNSAVFSVRSVVFSKVLYGKYSTVIHLRFTHTNAVCFLLCHGYNGAFSREPLICLFNSFG